jgi:hypothetical protein
VHLAVATYPDRSSGNRREVENMTASHVVERSTALAKRGTKQTCGNLECGNRFYDLKQMPSACPYCGTSSEAPPAVVLNFESLGRQPPRKYNRWVEPRKPAVEVSKVEDEVVDDQADKEAEIPSAAEELLIETEDDDTEELVADTSEIT